MEYIISMIITYFTTTIFSTNYIVLIVILTLGGIILKNTISIKIDIEKKE